MNWFMTVLRKYAVFEGRARRREYWFFVLFYILISVVLAVVDRMLGTYVEAYGMGALGALFCLGLLIPSIAVGVRRLLIGFIPLIGMIVLIVFFVLDSQPGTNAYGPNPKEAPAPA
jgi:uncharacterized membrane protein YhaH (DUF805 family)